MAIKTHYAQSGDVFVAYQVTGQSGPDLLMAPGFVSHLEHNWDHPLVARFHHSLGSFSRLICFDKRGTGLSDRGVGIPHLDERIDDIRAVLDAAGSSRPYLFGFSEGGPMSMLFAATYPERVAGLILFGTFARTVGASTTMDDLVATERAVRESWGEGNSIHTGAPSLINDRSFVSWLAKWERLGGSPTDVINLFRMNREIDVRPILSTIRVPTLIIHRRDDPRIRSVAGRELAQLIPNAQYVELPGIDHFPFSTDQEKVVEEIRRFMGASTAALESDRVLATVLFTDIVDSTKHAVAAGDRPWRSTLEAHNAAVRIEFKRYRGREVKTTGDGFMALFDGPARAVRCAQEIVRAVRSLGLEVRVGVHTGEVEVLGDDVGGIAVHIAARVAQKANASEVLASSTVKELVAGAGLKFAEHGLADLKGLSEPIRLFSALA